MNTLTKTLIALTAGSLMTAGAQAAVSYGNMTAQPYIGAKVGQYDLEDADDKATSYGIYGGAKFTPNWGIEAEYLGTSDADGVKEGTESIEYNGQVYGLYGTYDYTFPNTGGLYAKGRLGVAKNEIEADYKNTANTADNFSKTESDTGVAGGLGLGYHISPNAAVEVAYDWYPTIEVDGEDADASGITLGAKLKF